jgi:hypothetical protein
MHRGTALVALVLLLAATCRADLAVSHATVPAIFGDDATRARGKVKTKAASAKLKGPGKAEKAKVSAGFVGVLRPTETYDGAQADLAIPGLAHDSKAQARDVQGPGPDAPPRSAFESDGTQRMRRELARPEADLMREEPGVSPNEVQALDTGTGTAENVVTTTELLTPDTLPDAPADIDDDSEQLHDEDEVPQSISQKAATAAERAMKAAHRGMVAFSGSWSACLEQARLATSACRFENVDRCVRQLPAVASRLVPPSPARKGLQTLVSESMALWAAALWKILMLQVLVIMKTVISQGNVIARSFIQAACLESNALVPDSPLLQRQRSRARAIAAKNQADAARERMKELNLMVNTASIPTLFACRCMHVSPTLSSLLFPNSRNVLLYVCETDGADSRAAPRCRETSRGLPTAGDRAHTM